MEDKPMLIINSTSLKGKGCEPTCYLDYEDNKPSAQLGWNKPKNARWFFFTDVAEAIEEERIKFLCLFDNRPTKAKKLRTLKPNDKLGYKCDWCGMLYPPGYFDYYQLLLFNRDLKTICSDCYNHLHCITIEKQLHKPEVTKCSLFKKNTKEARRSSHT